MNIDQKRVDYWYNTICDEALNAADGKPGEEVVTAIDLLIQKVAILHAIVEKPVEQNED